MENEMIAGPFVRIVGIGCDVMIRVESTDDIEVAHEAINLAFKRYIKENQPKTELENDT